MTPEQIDQIFFERIQELNRATRSSRILSTKISEVTYLRSKFKEAVKIDIGLNYE